jgi:hypothetical protein
MAAHRCHARAASFLSMLALREFAEAARPIRNEVNMQSMQPLALTKSQLNSRNDKRAASRYARRLDIDNRNAERRLERSLREVWQT